MFRAAAVRALSCLLLALASTGVLAVTFPFANSTPPSASVSDTVSGTTLTVSGGDGFSTFFVVADSGGVPTGVSGNVLTTNGPMTSVRLSIGGGAFDLDGLTLVAHPSDLAGNNALRFTNNSGVSVDVTFTATDTAADVRALSDARLRGVTYVDITRQDGGSITIALDDVRLTVGGASSAPTVSSPTSASITSSSATLGGNVTADGGAAITERGVVYSVTSVNNNPLIGGPSATKVTAAGTTGIFTVNVSSLSASTGYSFKAYATNSVGTTYASVATFTTSAAADTTPPTLAAASIVVNNQGDPHKVVLAFSEALNSVTVGSAAAWTVTANGGSPSYGIASVVLSSGNLVTLTLNAVDVNSTATYITNSAANAHLKVTPPATLADAAGNTYAAGLVTEAGATHLLDVTAPTFAAPSINAMSSSGMTIGVTASEKSRGYWIVVPSGSTAPSAAQVVAGVSYTGATVAAAGNGSLPASSLGLMTVTGLSASTAYDLYVVAMDPPGNLSTVAADSFTTSAPPATAPTVTSPTSANVTALSATLGGNVTSDGGAAITERGVVYAATSANANPTINGAGGVTKVTAAGATGVFTVSASSLTASTGYSFKAYAINSAGTSYSSVGTFTTLNYCSPNPCQNGGMCSNTSSGALCVCATGFSGATCTSTVPGAPTIGAATAGNAQATVTFTAPASDGGSAITGYTVSSNPPGGVDSNAGSTGLSHVITGLTNGTAYTFTVRATNANGTGPASGASNSVTPATVPGAPTGISATAGNAQATVTFTAPASNGGSAITGYTVTSNPAGGVDANAGSTSTSHTITGLANGTSYTFTVTAANAVGTGAPSAASNAVTPTLSCNAGSYPSGGSCTQCSVGTFAALAGSTSCTPCAAGTYASSSGSMSCTLCASGTTSTAGSASCTPITYAITATANPSEGGTVSCSPNPVNHGDSATCTATPRAGFTFNGFSGDCTGTACTLSNVQGTKSVTANFLAPPGAPEITSLRPGNRQITVEWNAPTSNSAIIDYTATCGARSMIVASPATSAVVTGLVNGTSYDCSVTARNQSGSSQPSASRPATPKSPTTIVLSGPTTATQGDKVRLTWTVTGDDVLPPTGAVTASLIDERGGAVVDIVGRTVACSSTGCAWTVGALGTITITLTYAGDSANQPTTVSAYLAVVSPPKLTLTVLGEGSVEVAGALRDPRPEVNRSCAGGDLPCTFYFERSAKVSIRPGPPVADFTISGWYGACAGSATQICDLVIEGDAVAEVHFEQGAAAEKRMVLSMFVNVAKIASPEADALRVWIDKLTAIRSDSAWYVSDEDALRLLATEFLKSSQATSSGFEAGSAKAASTDAEFVAMLYRALFNRATDAVGSSFWQSQVAEASRDAVLTSFVYSAEFAEFARNVLGTRTSRAEVSFVAGLYRAVLARIPDAGGLAFHGSALRSAQCNGGVHARVASMASDFFGSAEYAARGRSNAQFVDDLYAGVLRRAPDLEGRRFWISRLDGGLSRNGLLAVFMDSAEFLQGQQASIAAEPCLR